MSRELAVAMGGLPARRVIADHAYDAHANLNGIEASGTKPITPQGAGMAPRRALDPALYKYRNRIQRVIGKLKQLRCFATR